MVKTLVALAAVALLGCSCSVPSVAPLGVYASSDTASTDSVVAPPTGAYQLHVGDYISSLWIGNPQAENYTAGANIIWLVNDDGVNCTFYVPPSSDGGRYNRLSFYFFDSSGYVPFEDYLWEASSYPKIGSGNGTRLLLGGGSEFVEGLPDGTLKTNRNVTFRFKTSFRVSSLDNSSSYFNQDFAIPSDDIAYTQYKRGYDDGYMPEVVRDLQSVTLVYRSGSGDSETLSTVTKTGDEAVNLVRSKTYNGLVYLYGLYDSLIPDSVEDEHNLGLTFSYSSFKSVDAAPVYIDYVGLQDTIDSTFQNRLQLWRPISSVIRVWYAFNRDLSVAYQGELANYPAGGYDSNHRFYSRISLTVPMPYQGAQLKYLGVLNGYSRGYADGVASRDGEIADLNNRVNDLENTLDGYGGLTYEQIFNKGKQAGLDEETQGSATFNSLFGNILTTPLTILNGLTEISFFGMPILTAILSLLMVALALYLFKRFK